MPGREDFGILRTRFFLDERAHAAATKYVELALAVEATALATVAGHVAMLGAFAARETDDGVLAPFAIQAALFLDPATTKTAIEALSDAGLLRPKRGGKWYIVGFKDCFTSLLERRSKDRERKREERRNAKNSLKTSTGRPVDVPSDISETSECYRSDPVRSDPVESPLPPAGGE